MKLAVLGSGAVGRTLAGKLSAIGNDVAVGTRDPQKTLASTETGPMTSETFGDWHASNPAVKVLTFAAAAAHGDIVFCATSGDVALAALEPARDSLGGKILIDVTNPLDFSAGFPPTLSVSNTESLGERIQAAFPEVKVVKTLNTVTAPLMVEPKAVADGDHHLFLSGNDQAAKDEVRRLLEEWFGWRLFADLGDITTARGPEMYLPLWLRVLSVRGPMFNVKIVG